MHITKIELLHEKYPTREFYPFNLKLLQQTKSLDFVSPITFFIGENGTGKSTLLRSIAEKTFIHIWESPSIKRLKPNPYEKQLARVVRVSWMNGRVTGSYFGAQIFNHFTNLLEEWAAADPGLIDYFGGRSLMTLSHGQSLVAFFKSRYKLKGLYLLDEPETALSPKSQLELVKVLNEASRSGGCQFIIATHSPILLATTGATIFSFDHAPIQPIDYEQTQYFQFYRDFLNNRKNYL